MLTTSIPLFALAAILFSTASSASSPYHKLEEYSGSSFFNGFDTFSLPDPTGGYVDYVDIPNAIENNLTAFIFYEELQASNAYIGVDYKQYDTNSTGGRKSVRLMSKDTFDVGLLTVIDVVHAPTGPGVWPAVWFLANVSGVVWPQDGEMDIMEWVNDMDWNAVTLHTGPNQCFVDNSDGVAYQGQLQHTDCNTQDGSLGCSIDAPKTIVYGNQTLATAGPGFNAQGGGVYVHEWTEDGVTVWLFPRNNTPPDLRHERPDPSSWTVKPLAKFQGNQCNFGAAITQQQLIIDITLCGQWAGKPSVWAPFANKTGSASCEAYVAAHPESFKDAFFEFSSIKIYSSNDQIPGIAGQSKVKRDGAGAAGTPFMRDIDEDCEERGPDSKNNTTMHHPNSHQHTHHEHHQPHHDHHSDHSHAHKQGHQNNHHHTHVHAHLHEKLKDNKPYPYSNGTNSTLPRSSAFGAITGTASARLLPSGTGASDAAGHQLPSSLAPTWASSGSTVEVGAYAIGTFVLLAAAALM